MRYLRCHGRTAHIAGWERWSSGYQTEPNAESVLCREPSFEMHDP